MVQGHTIQQPLLVSNFPCPLYSKLCLFQQIVRLLVPNTSGTRVHAQTRAERNASITHHNACVGVCPSERDKQMACAFGKLVGDIGARAWRGVWEVLDGYTSAVVFFCLRHTGTPTVAATVAPQVRHPFELTWRAKKKNASRKRI